MLAAAAVLVSPPPSSQTQPTKGSTLPHSSFLYPAATAAPRCRTKAKVNGVLARIKNSMRAPDPSTRPSDPFSPFSPRESTPDPRNEKTTSTPDPRSSGREVKRARAEVDLNKHSYFQKKKFADFHGAAQKRRRAGWWFVSLLLGASTMLHNHVSERCDLIACGVHRRLLYFCRACLLGWHPPSHPLARNGTKMHECSVGS